jgi:hypothetical protein
MLAVAELDCKLIALSGCFYGSARAGERGRAEARKLELLGDLGIAWDDLENAMQEAAGRAENAFVSATLARWPDGLW